MTGYKVQREFTGITFVDAKNIVLPKHHQQYSSGFKGYAIKAIALYATSFEEAFMLDSDNFPLADPTLLIKDASYKATGNMLWPDFASNTARPISAEVYRLLDLRMPWITQTRHRHSESGQVLLNRFASP